MSPFSKLIAMIASTLALHSAYGSECSSYVGAPPKILSFFQVSSLLSRFSPKGEFETTGQYEVRLNSALGSLPNPLVIARELREADQLTYDADKGALTVSKSIFGNAGFDVRSVFYHAKVEEFTKGAGSSNLQSVIFQTEKLTGSYMGSNAFGKNIRVQKSFETVFVVYDRPDRQFIDSLFSSQTGNRLGEIQMSPNEAKNFKKTYRTALVLMPKRPYLAKATYLSFEPTIEVPEETRTSATVIFADITCGLLMNAKGDVVAAYESSTASPPSRTISRPTSVPNDSYAIKVNAKIQPNLVFLTDSTASTVYVRIKTNSDGTILETSIEKSSGNSDFDKAVLDALTRMGTMPRNIDGKVPKDYVATVTMN